MNTASSNLLPPTTQNLTKAADLINAGKLVVLPTETVYGIALNLLHPEARAAARTIKGIPAGQPSPPWVIHVASAEDALAWVPNISSLGRRLLQKAFPGPVAFQIKLTPPDLAAARTHLGSAADETLADGFLTLRCPDFSQTQTILAKLDAPIAMIGAGTPAQPSVFEPADLPERLAAQNQRMEGVSGIIDGGLTRYKRSSTVVRIIGDTFSVTRPGVIDERIIQKMADFQILFICSGNTCRSPMAAALAARLLADRLGLAPSELPLRHIIVQSAGLHATRGLRAAREAVQAVAPLKADLGSHISQLATIDLLRRADVIYTMTQAHREEILEVLPSAAGKTHRLDPDDDVEDPIGASLAVYQQVAGRLVELLQKRLSELPL